MNMIYNLNDTKRTFNGEQGVSFQDKAEIENKVDAEEEIEKEAMQRVDELKAAGKLNMSALMETEKELNSYSASMHDSRSPSQIARRRKIARNNLPRTEVKDKEAVVTDGTPSEIARAKKIARNNHY